MIDEFIKKYQKYSRMFIGWWITLIATVFLTFINAFTGSCFTTHKKQKDKENAKK